MRAARKWMDARESNDSAEVATTRDALIKAFAMARFPEPQARDFVRTLDTPVVLSMYVTAPDQALSSLRIPVLAVYGTADTMIAPFLHAPAAARALSNNPDGMVAIIPGLDHDLAKIGEPEERANGPSPDPTATAVVELVAGWLSAKFNKGRKF